MSGSGIRRFIKCLTTVSGTGTGDASHPDGTKLLFHLKAEALPEDTDVSHVAVSNIPQLYGDVIDDSRHWKQPVELILGKQFKLEVLEECVKNMKLGEVTEFLIDKKMLSTYPIVSQTMRKALSKNPPSHDKEGGHRCCGMGIKEGLGHADLDGLIARPRHMKFTVELVKVELPGSYEKQFWEMTDDERRESVSLLRQQGNELFNNKRPAEAGLEYKEAIARLDNLMLREKPGDTDWEELNVQRMPLMLNLSQCQLIGEEYYSVIDLCTTVLQHLKDNPKALFRRGRAYAALCDEPNAQADLQRCIEVDPLSEPSCRSILAKLSTEVKKHNERDKKIYCKLFNSNHAGEDSAQSREETLDQVLRGNQKQSQGVSQYHGQQKDALKIKEKCGSDVHICRKVENFKQDNPNNCDREIKKDFDEKDEKFNAEDEGRVSSRMSKEETTTEKVTFSDMTETEMELSAVVAKAGKVETSFSGSKVDASKDEDTEKEYVV